MAAAEADAAPPPGDVSDARVEAWLPEEWSRRALREQLQAIADAVREVAGFGVVTVGVLLETEEMELFAVAGDERAQAELLGETTLASEVHAMVDRGEPWGRLRFLPHAASTSTSGPGDAAAPAAGQHGAGQHGAGQHGAGQDAPGRAAWADGDLLLAPVTGEAGELIAVLGFDRPGDGLRPGPAERERMAPYVDRAAAAVRAALERDRQTEHVRLTDAVRRVVRTATTRMPLDQLLPEVADALRESFGVELARITTLATPFSASRTVTAPPVLDNRAGPQRGLLLELAQRCWAARRVAVISERRTSPGLMSAEEHRRLWSRSRERGMGSLVVLPLGADETCLGWALLARIDTSLEWNDQQAAAALDIGHDLGRAVLQAQRLEQDSALTAELLAATEAKSRLIATVAHELKNPLGAILGHVELLDEQDHAPAFVTSVRGIHRSATRMQRMVDELLVLSRLDERPRGAEPIDLGRLAAAAVERYAGLASDRDVALHAERPAEPVRVAGSGLDLQHLVDALVENAVLYSDAGTAVRVTVEPGESGPLLSVADEGYGIPEADLERVFTEFYRSTNPRALAHPGTGLGLAIAARVARAHGARIDLRSELGRGSTFTVVFGG